MAELKSENLEPGELVKVPAWAWVTEVGRVRGTLNMRTGAYTTPCFVIIKKADLSKEPEQKK